MSEELQMEYPIWRIWMKKNIPLNEIKYEWTYRDLMKATAMMDMDDEYQSAIATIQEQEMKNKAAKGKR